MRTYRIPAIAAALLTACLAAASLAAPPATASAGALPASAGAVKDLSSFVDTYWYVPAEYLLSYVNVGGGQPAVAASDQTLWHFTKADRGYLLGCSYRSINGGPWSPSAIVGSIAPNNAVSMGFYGQILTVGTGTLVRRGARTLFLMQVSTGPAVNGVTHWAYMAKARPGTPVWEDLPGTDGQSVPSVDTGC
jgi:hypothetical protein